MRKLFKTAILGVSALALPFVFAATVNAEAPSDADAINTKLEYQVNANNNSMRFISTIELNGRTLDDITSIDMNFDLTKEGEETKHSKTQTTTTVYESISGENGKEKVDGTYYAVITITNIDSKSGWRITPTFTYNYEDGSTENVSASSWLIGGKRQYFVQAYTDWGTDLYYYMFGEGNVENKNWPGEQMHLYNADNNIYYFDYMPSAGYTTVIFNNGTHENSDYNRQTANMPVSSEYNYYLQQDANAFPHPTAEHNVTIQHDDNKHWKHCSICGDDFDEESHNLTGTTTGTTRTISCSGCGYSVSFDTTVLYLTNNWGWTDLYAYMFYNDGTNDVPCSSWPGVQMTFDHKNENDEDVYRVTIPSNAQYIIFNKGYGGYENQTINIKLSDYENYNAMYFVYNENTSEHTVGGYLYIPEHHQE